VTIVGRLSAVLERKMSRRNFVLRSAFAGSALSVGKAGFVLRPQTPYEELCISPYCGSSNCACSDTCCVGFTEFCCMLDGGYNSCPEGTVMGGWWLADGSKYCKGPRYYMDCNAACACETGCGSGYPFCDTGCDGLHCECFDGKCSNYLTGCFQFRYGQCNQDVGCIGRIKCRVVTCVAPWEIDDTCSKTLAVDDGTANQNSACLTPDPTYPPPVCPSTTTKCKATAMALSYTDRGYGVATSFGDVIGFGNLLGGSISKEIATPVVSMATSAQAGYWLLDSGGRVAPLHGAPFYGDALPYHLPENCSSMTAHPRGDGYWLLNKTGRVMPFGKAAHHGEPFGLNPTIPWVSIAATVTGDGYWVVTSKGEVKAYGDATFLGDSAGLGLEDPIVSVVANPKGGGYWLCSSGGRILPYGTAAPHGSPVSPQPPWPIVDMISTVTGNGYYVLSADGAIYHYGDAVYYGQAS
jgi:hypothetical protein